MSFLFTTDSVTYIGSETTTFEGQKTIAAFIYAKELSYTTAD